MSEKNFSSLERNTGKLLALVVAITGRISESVFKYVLDFLHWVLDRL